MASKTTGQTYLKILSKQTDLLLAVGLIFVLAVMIIPLPPIVLDLLLAMSFVAVSVGIERYLLLKKVRIEDFADKKSLELELTNKMHLIATIGSSAPYIGLLGTVLGIMLTFYSMGKSGFMDTNKIMVGLALALKVTAVGLLVAILVGRSFLLGRKREYLK